MEEEEEDEEEDEEEEADEAPSPAKRTRSSMKVNAAKNDVTDVNDLPGKICRCEFKLGMWKRSIFMLLPPLPLPLPFCSSNTSSYPILQK